MKRRRVTFDLAGADPPPFTKQAMLSAERIGNKRHLTPEGFLLCEDVPLARVGWMVYGAGETPVKTGDSGVTLIFRDAETLFSAQCIASFAGKSITNDHPPLGVSPENWSKVTVGTVHNLRRGAGEDHDVLLGDLLITDAAAIRAVQQGKREVSAGYDADYETTGPGEGRQVNIIGNHIALVERGRCGPRCAIGDRSHQPTERKASMPQASSTGTQRRKIVLSAANRQAVLDAGKEAMDAAMADLDPDAEDENTGDDSHIHIHLDGGKAKVADDATDDADPLDSRFKKIEDTLGSLSKTMDSLAQLVKDKAEPGSKGGKGKDPGDDDEEEGAGEGSDPDAKTSGKSKTGDSVALESSYKEVMADAEILVPGFAMPTFDAKAPRKTTIDSMCALRRRALDAVSLTTDGVALISTMAGGTKDLATLDCAAIAQLFRSAAGAKKLVNNRATVGDAARLPEVAKAPKQLGLAEIQALNRKMHPV